MESKSIWGVTTSCSNTYTRPVRHTGDDMAYPCSGNLLLFLLKCNTKFLENPSVVYFWFCVFIFLAVFKQKWAATCDFQQCGILTSVDSDKPVQPPYKLRNSKWRSVSSFTVIEYPSDKQRLWSDCIYVQADLSLCWSHTPHCWKSNVTAQMCLCEWNVLLNLSLQDGYACWLDAARQTGCPLSL